ncbi:hypothetical protein HNV12_23405 [Methanococcoides sp. SA1]|nr:hypothetical protein [Methanococcoides sp. SA1]
MIEPEELEGIVGALGAATHEEVISIVKELAYERDEDDPLNEEIEKMCEKAVSEHLLETISSEELSVECETCEECMDFYILGPNAFPEYPFELSEVIDILKLDRREVDSEKLKQRYSERLKTRLTELRYNIDKYSKNVEKDREFYLLGPNALPEHPFEISEVIEILKLNKSENENDSEKLKQRNSERLKARLAKLKYNIDKCSENVEGCLDIPTLEHQYSDLLNVYYDYDSWLEGGIADMESDILDLSKQIDSLGTAQDT